MANSYNGWPASENAASINVVQHPLYAGGIKAGDVTTVLIYVSDQLQARVEKAVVGHCWGYAYRANVNNPSSLSCHASGTAIDFNAPAHPNGASNTFTSAQVTQIKAILKEVEYSVKWLQGYDEMHFEIGVNASTLAGVAARLKGSTPPSGGTTPPPATGDDDLPLNQADKDWINSAVKNQLNQYFANGEGNPTSGRIVQACKNATHERLNFWLPRTLNVLVNGNGNQAYGPESTIALDGKGEAQRVWDIVMPGNADGGNPEKQQPGRKARDTLATLMTLAHRTFSKV